MEEGEVDREVDVGTMVLTEAASRKVAVVTSPANPWDMSGHVGSVVPMIIFLFIAHMVVKTFAPFSSLLRGTGVSTLYLSNLAFLFATSSTHLSASGLLIACLNLSP